MPLKALFLVCYASNTKESLGKVQIKNSNVQFLKVTYLSEDTGY